MVVVNVKSEIAGIVWKIQLRPGDTVEKIKVSEGEAIG